MHYCCRILDLSQHGKDAAKRGGWRPCIKVMEITLLSMENHGKIMELCFRISVGNLHDLVKMVLLFHKIFFDRK